MTMARDGTPLSSMGGTQHLVFNARTPLHKAQWGFLKTCVRTVLWSLELDFIFLSVSEEYMQQESVT